MQQKTYAITGVASGIGAELVTLLKRDGHRVIGYDINNANSDVDRFIALDLNSETAIDDAVSQTDEALHGLCNNAGLPPREGLEQQLLQVNFLGQRRFTKGMLSLLAENASIVNMASKAGHGWRDNLEQVKRLALVSSRSQLPAFIEAEAINPTRCYNLSKEAMLLWTAAESELMVAKQCRINSISPAAISTNILDDFRRAFGDKVDQNTSRTGRPGLPREVAAVARFLLSAESHWIKGTDIPVDGGMGAFMMSDALDLHDMQMLTR